MLIGLCLKQSWKGPDVWWLCSNKLWKLLFCIKATKSSATAEKQRVSWACLSWLANWSCNAQNTTESQMCNRLVVSTASAKNASEIRGRWSLLTVYSHNHLKTICLCVTRKPLRAFIIIYITKGHTFHDICETTWREKLPILAAPLGSSPPMQTFFGQKLQFKATFLP